MNIASDDVCSSIVPEIRIDAILYAGDEGEIYETQDDSIVSSGCLPHTTFSLVFKLCLQDWKVSSLSMHIKKSARMGGGMRGTLPCRRGTKRCDVSEPDIL